MPVNSQELQVGSSGELSQDGRRARLTTPLGKDKLVLARVEVDEGLSELFEIRIDALSRDGNINFDRVIGSNCCATLMTVDNAKRHFNGVAVGAEWLGQNRFGLHAYRLILRPWLWLLGRKSDCRIFSKSSVVDIIEKVFQKGGFSDFEVKANRGDYPKIEYCVQYRESDLAFVSRLMEEWGIYTFHKHTEGKHQLILADGRSCHVPIEVAGGKIPLVPDHNDARADVECFRHWQAGRLFRTGKMSTRDYDYMKPSAHMDADEQGKESYAHATLEAYDYPGRYTFPELDPVGKKKRAKVRLEAEQALDRRKQAGGAAPSLYPGALFTLERHGPDDGQYLVVRARHSFGVQSYHAVGGGSDDKEVYQGQYEMMKSDRPFRAPALTPKARVLGPQTGIVVTRKGKEGEEIDVDEEGRIFVQFFWNRETENISRPVRVSQMWSGKSWGWQFIPRVGQEVVIDFLEGDPDQPLVVGTVYNADNKYPYEMPANKTISGVKTQSTKQPGGFNEFILEDKKNEENIKMKAEKDHDTVVQNAETRVIGKNFKTPVGSPSRETTLKMGDEKMTVEKGDWNVDVAQKIHIQAKMMITIECGQSKIVMTPGVMTLSSTLIKIN